MPYAEGRKFHDADAHVVEPPGWLLPYADPEWRERIRPIAIESVTGENGTPDLEAIRAELADPADQSRADAEIMTRKYWRAMGGFMPEQRPRALDLLGFSSQLMFSTFLGYPLKKAEEEEDPALAYAMARAYNRAMTDFCAVDARLLPVCYVPLANFALAEAMVEEALGLGARALQINMACPRGHSHSHPGLDGVWVRAQEAGVPIVFHVRGHKGLIHPDYYKNGQPPARDFLGNEGENFTSVDYMAIPVEVMQALSVMIFDGTLTRFPGLKIGVVELGASWVPGWMRQMDAAVRAFSRHEERLQKLPMLPSEFARRQVRVTPYPTEDTGWIVDNSGPEMMLFNSDYPHVEGGRHPLKHFEASLQGRPEHVLDAFYRGNFEDLMGPALGGL